MADASVEPLLAPAAPEAATPPKPAPKRRPWRKAAMQYIRRGHLYFGLFLLPWVILYGITAFLFNHPTAFSDQPATEFGKDALAGTPMENPSTAADEAGRVVEALNARSRNGAKYALVEPEKAKYTRPTATATTKDGDRDLTVSINVNGDGGSVRARPTPAPRPAADAAPFAVAGRQGAAPAGRGGPGGGGGGRGGPGGGAPGGAAPGAGRGGPGGGGRGVPADVLTVADPLHDRVKAAAPVALERAGFAFSEITVTAVPDLSFKVSDGEKVWDATYNALNGSVAAKPADAPTATSELSARRFLTRLHLAHGYGDEIGYRWVWALIVDAMAFIMVFWGASGLLMWWQIKATRKLGALIVLLSVIAAVWIGIGMHELFTTTPRPRRVIALTAEYRVRSSDSRAR